jgi:hypothetical protein
VNVHHIHEVFTFLKIPRRELRNGLDCFALASVKAFSFLHRIRYAARSAGAKDAACHEESTSDHADGNDNGAALDSGDSADEAILASTLCHSYNTEPPVPSLRAFTQHTPDCVLTLATVRNGIIPAKAIPQCERRLLCPPQQQLWKRTPYITPHVVAGLGAQKSSRRTKSSLGTTIRGKHSRLITSSATVTTSRQQRFRPCLADTLQYKTFDTNDPALPIDTIQRYPPGYDSTKWTQWKNLERTGRGRI